jgi:hypothetical protein
MTATAKFFASLYPALSHLPECQSIRVRDLRDSRPRTAHCLPKAFQDSGKVFGFEYSDITRWEYDPEAGVVLWLSPRDAQTLENDLQRGTGAYCWPFLDDLEVVVNDPTSTA